MWCSKCKSEYDDGVAVCPECGSKLVSKLPRKYMKKKQNRSNTSIMPDNWPKGENGEPEKAVFLKHCTCVNMENQMLRNMLEGYGIPSIEGYPDDGGFGKVVLGMSASGADIYVPASMHDDALSLIGGNSDD